MSAVIFLAVSFIGAVQFPLLPGISAKDGSLIPSTAQHWMGFAPIALVAPILLLIVLSLLCVRGQRSTCKAFIWVIGVLCVLVILVPGPWCYFLSGFDVMCGRGECFSQLSRVNAFNATVPLLLVAGLTIVLLHVIGRKVTTSGG
ncbi:hypothetical protein FYJ24_06070 [Actinomycetaceae bacterium WB03_NA08]|uniref:Uncharacterized protein n=1 Tax=Scrofimicrobium canadense TaxID=2652290 RepID=A0A6N7W4U4_9ACTO|nr:hypothetical protein [Scrofimicrobium canadense]MSS84335.1 hypothetical protein [Scrofimicrobium canadense]